MLSRFEDEPSTRNHVSSVSWKGYSFPHLRTQPFRNYYDIPPRLCSRKIVTGNSQNGVEVVYLPTSPTAQLQSFSAPILNLQDTHVDAPFFGANSWTGILTPVSGGNIPAHHAYVKISMTFKEGGAFEFASTYERIKETITQAVEVARESGGQQGPDLSDINLEQLPAYEEVGTTVSSAPPPPLHQPSPIAPRGSGRVLSSEVDENPKQPAAPSSNQQYPPPDEPPPGYEEAQQNSIADDLEQRLRNSSG
ncbi:MAG: hypothetical protein Q9184_003182 [Pyrenodesmia sp. 2 TL-2023]